MQLTSFRFGVGQISTRVNMLPNSVSRPFLAFASSHFPVFMSLVGLLPMNNVFLRGLPTNKPRWKSHENTKKKRKINESAGQLASIHRFGQDTTLSRFIQETNPLPPPGTGLNWNYPQPRAPPSHWGITTKNIPCKICIRKGDFCAKHEHQRGRK